MNKYLLLLVLFFASILEGYTQQIDIKGQITDTEGKAIPFVSVFVKGTSKGVSANVEGVYSISVDRENTTLSFTIVGYKTTSKVVSGTGNIMLNVTLEEERFSLNSVTVKANGEDPAYKIIRNAIKNRKAYLNEIFSYSADVYIKGMQKLVGAPKKLFGRDIQKTLDLDTNRNGILYLSESQSKFAFMKPDKIKEEMISSKVSGRNSAFSFNKASDMRINFYENLVLENTGLSARSFVSPIADNALFYYQYKLIGKTSEAGNVINKIEVTPKRKNDPAFRGYIYIADENWRLMATDLNLTADAGINIIDTLNIAQNFIKVDQYFMPGNLRFSFNGGVFGFKFQGYFISFYNNYQINPDFEKGFFTPEILKITKSVNKKDSTYWAEARPIPLTLEEKKDYIRKDSIALKKQSKPYLDSVERAKNKFSIGKMLLTPYQKRSWYHKKSVTFEPLIESILYNTVEGFALRVSPKYQKTFENNRVLTMKPELRYGFANETFTANLTSNYVYDPIKRASIGLDFGSAIKDLNDNGTMRLSGNTINSLLFETNFLKLFKQEFIKLNTQRELANGLQAYLDFGFVRNYALTNRTLYTFRDRKDKEFTSNNPLNPVDNSPMFADYNSSTVTTKLVYTIGQRYITRPDSKVYTSPKYPKLSLTYKQAINGLFGGDTDYSLVTFDATQERINLGLFGYSSISVGAGKFLNSNKLYYPEYKHFLGTNPKVFTPELKKFRFFDFYRYSTNAHYFEAHFEHNFSGFITNKIPFVRKLKLEETLGVNYLYQPEKKNYTEYYVGLQRLLFGVSYGFAYDGNKRVSQGLKFMHWF